MICLLGSAPPLALLAIVLGGAAACSGPPPKVYVLGDGISAVPEMVSQLNKASVEVRPVRVPDYLDTTDIVTRGVDGLIVPSQSGRWGERLSTGLARAVAAELTRRLPQLAITTSARWGEPKWQVGIELEAFDVKPAENCTLVATWNIIDVQHRKTLTEERVVLSDPGTFETDARVVAAMGRQVADLAGRIADALAPIAEGSGKTTRKVRSRNQ